MYQIKLINPHKQFGKITYSMLFEDSTGEVPSQRWEKKYPDTVTRAQAIADIKATIRAFAVENNITWEDANLNGVEVTVDRAGQDKLIWTI